MVRKSFLERDRELIQEIKGSSIPETPGKLELGNELVPFPR
jgi:hypothetical protein